MNERFPSDLDAAEAVSGIPDDELLARDLEQARIERWAAFVAWLRREYRTDYLGRLGWSWAVSCAADALRWDEDPTCQRYDYGRPYLEFAETEGWDGVLQAIARAMREEQQDRERTLTQG